VAPLLFVLIFGVIEFGWAYLQYLDVKHAAREGGRLAAVNYGTGTGTAQADEIIDETCTRIDDPDGVSFTLTMPGGPDIGDTASVTVSREFDSLTGFFNFTSLDFESTVEVRLEQDATWADQTKVCP
jgi:Flp pilus assembly protein TadG